MRNKIVLLLQLSCMICFFFRESNSFIVTSSTSNSRSFYKKGTSSTTTTTTTTTTMLSAGTNANEFTPLVPGSFVALVTPMTQDGKVDIPALTHLLRYHVESQTDGLCVLGTTGESTVLSMEERDLVLTLVVDECKGKLPILAGTGTIDPQTVRAYTMHARDVGCDAALVVTPYYVKPPQRALVRHFIDLADDTGMPLCLYNVPGRTKVDMLPSSVAICAQHENIVALKDATGDLMRLKEQLQALDNDSSSSSSSSSLLLYSGDDGTTKDFCLGGGNGGISVTANVAAKQMHNMVQAALAKDEMKASDIDASLQSLHRELFCEANPIPVKHAVYKLFGGIVSSNYCRPPLCPLETQYERIVEDAMKDANL